MLNIKIALKFLLYKPFETIMALITVLFGTAIFFVIMNIGEGLKDLVLYNTSEMQSHIYITGQLPFEHHEDIDTQKFISDIYESSPYVTDVAFSITKNVLVYLPDMKSRAILLKAVDFQYGKNIQDIEQRILLSNENEIPKSVDDINANYIGEVVLGRNFLKTFDVIDSSELIDRIIDIGIDGTIYKFKVVGVSPTVVSVFVSHIYTNLATLQNILNTSDATNLEINVNNPINSTKALNDIRAVINDKYPSATILDWQSDNEAIINVIYIEDVTILIIEFFTAVAISFGVASILGFNMNEKSSQIGILKALGIKDNDAGLIFFIQTLIISIVGVMIGLLFGNLILDLTMIVFRDGAGYPLLNLSASSRINTSIITSIIIIAGSVIACLRPILSIRKLKIIEVIKSD